MYSFVQEWEVCRKLTLSTPEHDLYAVKENAHCIATPGILVEFHSRHLRDNAALERVQQAVRPLAASKDPELPEGVGVHNEGWQDRATHEA